MSASSKKKGKGKRTGGEADRLLCKELFEIKKMKVTPNVWKDGKKLEALLEEMSKTINTIVKCAIV